MKPMRAVLTVLAVATAGFLAFRGCQGRPDDRAAPDQPRPDEVSGGGAFPTLLGDAGTGAVAQTPKPAPPPAPPEESPRGELVTSGTAVSLVIPYRTGTKTKYRVAEAQLSKDRASEVATWWQFVWNVSTEVAASDDRGAARIRFQIDSFRFQTEAMGRPIDFDSANPDKVLLADEALALGRTMYPAMAILGMPLEFTLDPAGRITNVEGADEMNRRYLEAVDAFGAKYVADAIDAPTAESLTEKWSELLFPPIGGGSLAGGAAREGLFRTTYFERWAALSKGAFRVTHADAGSFRVEFKGKPEIEERQIPARTPMARAIEKVHVISSADSYVNAWTFDRVAGRLLGSRLSAKYQVWIARPLGLDAQGQPDYNRVFTDIERRVIVELLDD